MAHPASLPEGIPDADLADVALGDAPADLVLKNGRVVNVFTAEIEEADVAVAGGRIAALGRYDGDHTIDLEGRYLAPGYIDAHVHIESSHITPSEYARAVIPRGTVAAVADPHELGNIGGAEAIRWFIADAAASPLTVHTMVPSCVPASPFETPGAVLGIEEVAEMKDWNGVYGLAEVMNFPGVLAKDAEVIAKLAVFHDDLKDGHVPGLGGAELCAYLTHGIVSDHETVAAAEATEKIARGMYVGLRQGSSAQNLVDLLPAVNEHTSRRCMLVDDDRSPADLSQLGHIDDLLRRCVSHGVDPITALQMASINPSEYLGRRDLGAISPGRRADLVVLDDLSEFRAALVLIAGKVVARDGRPLWQPAPVPPPNPLLYSMHVDPVGPETFSTTAAGTRVRIIIAQPGSLLTETSIEEAPVVDGQLVASPERDLAKIAVAERHHHKGTVGVGLIRGLGFHHGAIASTMAHDAHQLIVCGVDDEDMAVAANHLIDIGGGFAVVRDRKVVADLPMQIAGIVSSQPFEDVARLQVALRGQLHQVVHGAHDPFDIVQFMALTVIPELKICDRGLVDVGRWEPVDLFAS